MNRWTFACIVLVLALSSRVSAGGGDKECKPSGMPNALGQTGDVEVAQPVDYWSQPWLLVTNKLTKPDKVRLVSASGQIVEIGKPPITVEPVQWLARGRAVYALGRGRSETPDKTDVVLMRWGTDPRPRLTNMRTGVTLEGQLTAAFANEFLAVSWAEKAADGKLHRMVSFLDIEQLKLHDPKDLGEDSGSVAHVAPREKGFTVLWTAKSGVMQARFDQFGKATAPTTSLAWAAGATPAGALALAQCGEVSWLVRDSGQELALSAANANGPMKELARVAVAPRDAILPVRCVNESLVFGRRTVDKKANNVVFWVSTVDSKGKVRDRRVKDMRGTEDDIRMPQFSQIGAKLTSWWIQGKGAEAKVWSRELDCQ